MRTALVLATLLLTTACSTTSASDGGSGVISARPAPCPTAYVRKGNRCVQTTPVYVAPTVSISDATADENEGQMVFTLRRSGDLSLTSRVHFQTVPDSALADTDFSPVSSDVEMGPGVSTQTVSVSLINDSEPEPTKVLGVTLTSVLNAVVASPTAVGTLTDTDVTQPPTPPPSPTFSVPDATVNEAVGTVTLHISKSENNGLKSVIKVTADPGHGLATPGEDFTAVDETITVAPEQMDVPVTVPIINDSLHEDPENFNVTVTAVENAQVNRAGIVTIVDDDVTPVPPPSTSWTVVPLQGAGYARVTQACSAWSGETLSKGMILKIVKGQMFWTPYRNESDAQVPNPPGTAGAYMLPTLSYDNPAQTQALYVFTDCLEGLAPAQ